MAITFGSSAPSQETRNFDSLFTASLSNYSKTLIDNISTSNSVFLKIKQSEGYVSKDGGTDVKFPLLYALGDMEWYSGYDTLSTDPMDGTTMGIWEWREAAIPITVSRLEMRQNAQKLIDLVKTKVMQAEMGIQEGLAKALLQGNLVNGGNVYDVQTNAVNGAQSFDPLARLIQSDPSVSTAGLVNVGNINQSTYSWWRNNALDSTATNYEGFINEVQTVYNNCSKGIGGPPDLMVCDQFTYEMFERALVNRGGGRLPNGTNTDWPFENIRWKRSMVVWDEFIPNVKGNAATGTAAASDSGTIYFLNTKFLKMFYDSNTNFIQTDWKSAYNQPNAQTKHILWMGGTAVTNRRKQGVLYGISNNLTS